MFSYSCRNILLFTNTFSIADMNITEGNYEKWLSSLNETHPYEVAKLDLKTCNLQTFLDQVKSLKFMN